LSDKLAINGGPKAVINALNGWPNFDEKAKKALEAVGILSLTPPVCFQNTILKFSRTRKAWLNRFISNLEL
jgi:hypothetical protein